MTEPEIINIGISKTDDTIQISNSPLLQSTSSPGSKSVNFGPGVDMLMNTKHKNGSSTPKSDINLDDLSKLEDELNNLSSPVPTDSSLHKSIDKKSFISTFTTDSTISNDTIQQPTVELNKNNDSPIKLNVEPIKLKEDIQNNGKQEKTWDGFQKFNDIPIDPNVNKPVEKPMTRGELLREKMLYIRKLETISRKGANVSKKYTMDDSLDEIRGEYELLISEREKKNSVKFYGQILTGIVTALEWGNKKLDPFDLKLDGWSETISENMDDYDDIFGELHEKYKSKGKMAPELKLLMQLAGSGMMLHMSNTLFKSAMPGMEDIMRQNPELAQQFTNAAVNSMSGQNPGFANFMGNMMHPNEHTKNTHQQHMPEQNIPQREKIIPPGPSRRPDIGMSHSIPNFKDAEDIDNTYGSLHNNDTIHETQIPKSQRPEMKGPSNIDDLLNGLKKTNINLSNQQTNPALKENSSTISMDELKSIMKDVDNIPRKSKRRGKSDKKTLSLDI